MNRASDSSTWFSLLTAFGDRACLRARLRTDKLQTVIDAAVVWLRTLMKDAARATHSLGGSVAAAQEFNGHCPRRSEPVLIDAQAFTR
jgi:hypothetical protein